MDGQRLFSQSLSGLLTETGDCRLVYRIAMRCGAVLSLLLVLLQGAEHGGSAAGFASHSVRTVDPLAAMLGQVAEDIEIIGLSHHDPALVIQALGVRPGGSLLGFAPARAKKRLEALDWVESASVRREFPNQLIVSVVERQPFALWQLEGTFRVVDRNGVVISASERAASNTLLVVTGDKANEAVAGLVNQLEGLDDLSKMLRAASRVGKRRWNLYLANGTKILLPAEMAGDKTKQALFFAQSRGLLSGTAAEIDLRMPGVLRVAAAQAKGNAGTGQESTASTAAP